jgi:hypothetical protein
MTVSTKSQLQVADEVWIVAALLHRDHPEQVDFSIDEIVERAERQNLYGRDSFPDLASRRSALDQTGSPRFQIHVLDWQIPVGLEDFEATLLFLFVGVLVGEELFL